MEQLLNFFLTVKSKIPRKDTQCKLRTGCKHVILISNMDFPKTLALSSQHVYEAKLYAYFTNQQLREC